MVRQLNHFTSKFDTVTALRAKLVEEFKDDVPNTMTFKVGYYEGPKHSKMWIVTNEDLKAMYETYVAGEITLWC